MFRKVKKKKTTGRRKLREDDEEQEDEATSQLLQEARNNNNDNSKRPKTGDDSTNNNTKSSAIHHYAPSEKTGFSEKDLATRTSQQHPTSSVDGEKEIAGKGSDGIFRDKTRNKFHAGPIKASTFVRTTARFDYQPDICKDYKDTGFCGFGDTCIYLHDRGDSMTGWQLEQQWEEQKKKERAKEELEAFADGKTFLKENPELASDDGLPFACFICRRSFNDPVVTRCGHYFCEKCILDHIRSQDKPSCAVCRKDTHGVFNQPTKLISKKRRLLSSSATWKEFHEAQRDKSNTG
mmetsp:Transcript_23922/g.36182  ORF Transcript_23922/g.36182 Transcript_23922/m.36182 type:complete len:293 (+) Transcript_23922:34-912(+)